MKIKEGPGVKIFTFFNTAFMVLFCVSIIFPFLQQLVLSTSTPVEALKPGLHIIPTSFTTEAYVRIFSAGQIGIAYYWTIMRALLGTTLTLVVSAMLAYPLAKQYLPLRTLWTGIIVFTMFFGGGLIPTYFLVRDLGLLDTIWALVLPGLCSAYTIVIMRNFFMSIPEELDESAKLDGASELMIFFRIIIPLSLPILATVALWSIVGHWNSWFDAMIYMTKNEIKVLQSVLRQVLNESNYTYAGLGSAVMEAQAQQERKFTPETVKAAILMASTIPVLCVYPFVQKYFVKGIMVGSLKG